MHLSSVIALVFMAAIHLAFAGNIDEDEIQLIQVFMCLNETEEMSNQIVDCMRKAEGFERYDQIQMECFKGLASPQSEAMRDYICENYFEDVYKGMVCMEDELENAPDKDELVEHMKPSKECLEERMVEWMAELESSEEDSGESSDESD
ncbi:uncharacterized protein LOC118199548 isoform X1 [Stegodyphus dumicola]|uniref:uncharacterized protein LOC118199548 isoform X1 n=1 Tax=Stegodyphus dumicola TaxID=202533 RepID=UPI0015B0C21B|nr:uncharacterized protein LOC118199548 isoform X1 [Stegodyphus dumicola]